MGIKSLNPFLKEKVPAAFQNIPYSYFKGKRVAIDSDNVLRKLMSRAHKEIVNQTDVCSEEPDRSLIVQRWLIHIKDELRKFLHNGITPIFIFDGAYIDAKSKTQLKRREDKQKKLKEAEDLKCQILQLDELERTPQMVTDLRKKMHHLGYIKPDEKELIINIFKSLGIPVLFATEEGEKLCAMLNIEGKVDAVYSRDTDVVALGAPLSFGEDAGWIYNPESKRTEMSLKCTVFRPILSTLKMEYETFLDLCIMSGCDFNDNIYRVGVNTSYKLLKTYKNIDRLPEKYKKDVLNHTRCREIFKREKAQDICQTEIILNIDMNKDYDIQMLKEYGVSDWVNDVLSLYSNFPIPSNTFIEKPPSYSASRVNLRILGDKKIETKEKIPKQKASPKKLTNAMISSLASAQVSKLKEKLKNKS